MCSQKVEKHSCLADRPKSAQKKKPLQMQRPSSAATDQ
jgi:hypothetical protein